LTARLFALALELGAPAGLWALALLAPLVALYVLRVRRKRRRVASTWLWQAAARDSLARSPWRRLVPEAPLALEALAIAALALALARPATRGSARLEGDVALIVDTSASMGAVDAPASDGAGRRIDRARETARALVRGLAPGGRVMVIDAGRAPRVVSPLESDRARVLAAIDALAAREVEGDLAAAVALAADRMRAEGGDARIVVITDGDLAGGPALPASSAPIELVTVGSPVDNAAIVRVDVRARLDAEGREEVAAFLVVESFGARPRELYVTMREDNASDVLASRKVLLAPSAKEPVALSFYPTAGDRRRGLVLELSPRDALEADDVAYARVPPDPRLPVALVAPRGRAPSPWLERALAADEGVALRTATLDELAAGGALTEGLAVVEGACPDLGAGVDLLVVDPPEGACFGATVGAPLDEPAPTSWEEGDPRLRFVSLDGVRVRAARRLEPASPARALVRARRGVIAADASTAARNVTILGFDVGESDWPLRASFVLFTRNVVEQARARRERGVVAPARTGDPLRVLVPASAARVRVEDPSGAARDVSAHDGLLVVPDTDRAGFYRLAWSGPPAGSLLVAASLASEAESRLGAAPLEAPAASEPREAAVALSPARADWTWLAALAALALIVADVAVLTRAPRREAATRRPSAPPARAR
jgi:hypothetical protein